MKTRLVNAVVFLGLYLAFLSWYDGWGMDPLTTEEIDKIVGEAEAQDSNPEELKNLRQLLKDDDGEEFFMLNLNRYEYSENEVQKGVPVAYQKYGQAVMPMILKRAGHPIYVGEISDYLVGGDLKEGGWHEIILVRYRSRQDFINMITSDEYLIAAKHRYVGIEYAEVIPTNAILSLATPRLFILALLFLIALVADCLIRRARS
ncbi:MAG: DUF1330 domain-containing protein [SAR324 cluster bacterium]|nr:DUF1330 domain-containing protein [SAR324 cluster bacterium]